MGLDVPDGVASLRLSDGFLVHLSGGALLDLLDHGSKVILHHRLRSIEGISRDQ